MKLKQLFTASFAIFLTLGVHAQDKDMREASSLGEVLSEDNEDDIPFFGNWEVIPDKSGAEYMELLPEQDGPAGQYLILKPTSERSSISSYRDEGFHSVDLGFYTYRKGDQFYANLDASTAVMFQYEFKGILIEFTCEYMEDKDQLKLTTSKDVVFYLKRIAD